jgi:hypothetical protein
MTLIQNAVDQLSNHHEIVRWVDSNEKLEHTPNRCLLSTGIEYSFVGIFCQNILQRFEGNNPINFNDVFYIPNLKAEAVTGYDLSIGHYLQNNRIRTMHKVINRRYCDQSWVYSIKNIRRSGDYAHFSRLILIHNSAQNEGISIYPYLVLNVCNCIHDYRRMGCLYQETHVTIPPFNSTLRTIIIDLPMLNQRLRQSGIEFQSDEFEMSISRNPSNKRQDEITADYLSRISNEANLVINACRHIIDSEAISLSFDEFIGQANWGPLMLI